jgi:hypothetical protein
MTRDGRSSGRASGAGTSPVGDAGGPSDHDDPELDEILAAFQRRPRRSGAVVALSELVAEPVPLASEPSGREGETVLLTRTKDRERRLQARTALLAAAILALAAAAALWFALRPRTQPVTVPSGGTASSQSRPPPIVGAGVEVPASVAASAASPSGSASRPVAPVAPVLPASPSADRDVPAGGRRVPTAPPPASNLDPEFKRSM